jgi:hypothetical protein
LCQVQEVLTEVRHELVRCAQQEAALGERLQQTPQQLLGAGSVFWYVADKRDQLGYQDRHEDYES